MQQTEENKEKKEASEMLRKYEKALLAGTVKAEDVPYYRERVAYWSKKVDRFDNNANAAV